MKRTTIATALAGMMLLSATAHAAAPSDFSDFPSDWSAPAVTWAVENSLLNGHDGKLNPQGFLTRAELAAIVNRAFGAAGTAAMSGYTDVPASAWYYAEMAKAVKMGTFTGADGKLTPEAAVTREEAFTVLSRAFVLEDGSASVLDGFPDGADVSPWAVGGVAALIDSGCVNGAGGRLYPGAGITRAEFAQVISSLTGTYIAKGGTPPASLDGNAAVRESGVTLDGITINGDLIIADGAGSITLNHVAVTGRIVVRGGADGVRLTGTTAGKGLVVDNPGGAAVINCTDGNPGTVTARSSFAVEGRLDNVIVEENATLTVRKDARVGTVTVNADGATVTGDGRVTSVEANANHVSVTNPGARVTAASGTTGVTAGDRAVEAGKTVTVGTSGGSGSGGGSSSGGSAQAQEYPISFDANGGSGAPAAVKTVNGKLAALPAAEPVREGYRFAGWCTVKDDAGTKVAAGASFAANTTLYALWAELAQVNTPAITFADHTGAVKTGTEFLTTDTFTITCATEGASVYYTTDGTEPTVQGAKYTDAVTLTQDMTKILAIAVKDGMKNSAVADSGAITVSAPASACRVTFAAGEGSGAMSSADVPAGTAYVLPANGFAAPQDQVFDKWSVKAGDADAIDRQPGDTVTIDADTTVTAVWREAGIGEIKYIGYEPIADLEVAYSSNYLSDYPLPKQVTLQLSNGRTAVLDVSSWTVKDGMMAEGSTITAKAIWDSLPSELQYNNKFDASSLDEYETLITMKVRFVADPGRLDIEWDPAHVQEGYYGDEITYAWNENPIITVKNYSGDGSDIRFTSGYGADRMELTVGNGLSWDAEASQLTLDSAAALKNGVPDYGSLNGTLYFGTAYFSVSITYTTDRSAVFEGSSGWGDVTYSEVSRKKSLIKTVTFVNVPEEDALAAVFRFSDGTAAEGVTLTKAGEDTYQLTVPFAAVESHLSSSYFSDYVKLTMTVRGMEQMAVTIEYMGAPELTPDQPNGYYASENPVITLKNFSFDQTAADNVSVSLLENGGGEAKTLSNGTDYTVSSSGGTARLTLISSSANVLGTGTLSVEKHFTLTVNAEGDGESASVDVRYKKDRALHVSSAENVTPYTTARVTLSGSEDGYDGLKVYCGDAELPGITAESSGYGSSTSYYIELPYQTLEGHLQDSRVTLTARLDSLSAQFTVAYGAVSEEGSALPIDTTKLVDYYGEEKAEKQGTLPMSTNTAGIYIVPAEGSTLTEDDWKDMGVTLEKKGSPEHKIILKVNSASASYGSDQIVIALNSLWNYDDELRALYDFDSHETGTDWPVFTLTFYKTGYQPTTMDIVLYQY